MTDHPDAFTQVVPVIEAVENDQLAKLRFRVATLEFLIRHTCFFLQEKTGCGDRWGQSSDSGEQIKLHASPLSEGCCPLGERVLESRISLLEENDPRVKELPLLSILGKVNSLPDPHVEEHLPPGIDIQLTQCHFLFIKCQFAGQTVAGGFSWFWTSDGGSRNTHRHPSHCPSRSRPCIPR